MKFKFSLQKVLEHRKILENLAQRAFEEAQSEQIRQQEILMDMINGQHEARQEAGRVQQNSVDSGPERLKQIHQFTVLQDVRIERQRAKVAEAGNLVEEKREILRQKAIDSKIMERLREKKRDEFLLEQKQIEQKEVDEINVLRYDAKDGE